MNFVKKFLIKRTKKRIGISGNIKILLLLILDLFIVLWRLVNLFYSSVRLVKGLSQEFYQAYELRAIAKR